MITRAFGGTTKSSNVNSGGCSGIGTKRAPAIAAAAGYES